MVVRIQMTKSPTEFFLVRHRFKEISLNLGIVLYAVHMVKSQKKASDTPKREKDASKQVGKEKSNYNVLRNCSIYIIFFFLVLTIFIYFSSCLFN